MANLSLWTLQLPLLSFAWDWCASIIRFVLSQLSFGYLPTSLSTSYSAFPFFVVCLLFASFLLFSSVSRRQSCETFFAYQTTKRNESIVRTLKERVADYQGPWWYNSHLGTMLHFGAPINLQYERQCFSHNHQSSTSFVVDWYPHKPHKHEKNLKICVFLHGKSFVSHFQ